MGVMTTTSPPTGDARADGSPDGADDAVVLGVSAWLARRFAIPSGVVRIAFVILAFAGGVGVLLYAVTWLIMRSRPDPPPEPPREAHSDLRGTIAVVMIVLGLLLFVRRLGLGFSDAIVWPVAVVGAGLAFVWPHLGDRGVSALLGGVGLDESSTPRWMHLARWSGGTLLVVFGLVLFLATNQSAEGIRDGIVTVVVIVGGLALLFGSFVQRLVQSLVEERRQRIRSDERAMVAAHLHDSVLQTLSLIQRRADEPGAVARLARRQERELRRWLYDPGHQLGLGMKQLLETQVEQIEDEHLIDVETVVVGDIEVDGAVTELVAAAGEALVNAAKFSGEERVSLYAEVSDQAVEVFVRDRGVGFDLDAVPPDRHGVRDSIMRRMQRIGGSVDVITDPGVGTEVELRLPRPVARAETDATERPSP
jgi:signal transduction histidine kinase/phage shock protein PspC (stress-responsive transcriptional regulator)